MFNLSATSCQEQVTGKLGWVKDDVSFVLDHHAELDFYGASSLKQQSTGRHVALTTKLHSLWYVPTMGWTHNLSYSRLNMLTITPPMWFTYDWIPYNSLLHSGEIRPSQPPRSPQWSTDSINMWISTVNSF